MWNLKFHSRVHELAAYTQLTEEELSDILLLIQKADQKDK